MMLGTWEPPPPRMLGKYIRKGATGIIVNRRTKFVGLNRDPDLERQRGGRNIALVTLWVPANLL